MSDKMLTRYKLLDDVHGEVLGVMPRLVHDFCEGYEMVDADDAAREIGQLYNEVRRLESNRDGLVIEIERLEARLAQVQEALKQIARDGCRMPWAIACTRTNGGEQWCEGCIAELALHELERSGV